MAEFDKWCTDGTMTAWAAREVLKSVEDADEPIFPPTFTPPQNKKELATWVPYVIDEIRGEKGAKNVCMMDTIGAQSNKMEVIFRQEESCRILVPQHAVAVTPQKVVSFMDVPQRVGDAVVRFSKWREEVEAALYAYRDGDAEPLARLAPTSLVFGFFDARGTLVKGSRLVRSTIRAYDVDVVHARGSYVPPVDYIGLGLVEPLPEGHSEAKRARKSLSEIGLLHCPTEKPESRGGVIVRGEIVRHTTINLVALRNLRAGSPASTEKLRRYLLGLSLVAATYPQAYDLRQGCLLRRVSMEQRIALRESEEKIEALRYEAALKFATLASEAFGVAPGRTLPFDQEALGANLGKTKAQRKAERQGKRNVPGPSTNGDDDDDEDGDDGEE